MSHRERRLHDQDPEQRQSRRRPPGAARAGELASRLYRLVDGHGAGRFPGRARSICAPPSRSIRKAGPSSITSRCPNIAGASCWRRRKTTAKSRSAAIKASRSGRTFRANIAPCCAGSSSSRATPSRRPSSSSAILGKTAPSLYDMRNVFQVNVEEGRHLWAMVYILQKYFGRDGREEAAELLQRRSGDADKPRMLGAFNEATPDWLSFHMFTFFTDRDGKMQLESLAQSGFDPLSRTCRFMLTEEAHHMFVGETGVGRTIQRTCEAMKAAGIEDPNDIGKVRELGVIDLPTMQKKLNLHYSLSLDLFGSEMSTNAANTFTAGAQGPLPGNQDRRRSSARKRDLSGAEIRRRRDQAGRRAGADRDQHAAARRLHRRLPARPRPLEQDHRQDRRRLQARTAACRLPSPDRRVQGRESVAGRRDRSTTRHGSATSANGCRRRTTAISSPA